MSGLERFQSTSRSLSRSSQVSLLSRSPRSCCPRFFLRLVPRGPTVPTLRPHTGRCRVESGPLVARRPRDPNATLRFLDYMGHGDAWSGHRTSGGRDRGLPRCVECLGPHPTPPETTESCEHTGTVSSFFSFTGRSRVLCYS